MNKAKQYILIIAYLFTFPVAGGYSQEAVIMPADVAEQNIAVINEGAPHVSPGNVTVNFKEADIRAVLNYLSEVSGVDIVPAPDVSGPITLKLTNKPWKVALDIIVKNYGYAYEREGNIIRVVTISSLKLEALSTEVIILNYASAEDTQEAVKDMLTERGKLTYDSRINALVVTDLATNIYKIREVIGAVDMKTPQVMIEAKIIETALNETERLGIDWNLIISASGAKRPTTLPFSWRGEMPYLGFESGVWNTYMPRPEGDTTSTITESGSVIAAVSTVESEFPLDLGGIDQAFHSPFPVMNASDFIYGTLDFSQFSAVLEFIKSRSDTDIISNPRITTLNNKEAKMFVGKVYNYISEIEQKEDTGGQERWVYKIEKEEIGVRLLVTPHVNVKGDIEVEIKPEIKDVIGFQQVTQFFSLPIFTTREAATQVMAKDGDTIFIGGLIKENVKKYDKKFPFLGDLFGDIPLIGHAFKYKAEMKEKTELIIFLTVHIVKDAKWLNNYVTESMTEIRNPLDIYEEPKKEYKPLFNFRKKKNK